MTTRDHLLLKRLQGSLRQALSCLAKDQVPALGELVGPAELLLQAHPALARAGRPRKQDLGTIVHSEGSHPPTGAERLHIRG